MHASRRPTASARCQHTYWIAVVAVTETGWPEAEAMEVARGVVARAAAAVEMVVVQTVVRGVAGPAAERLVVAVREGALSVGAG